MPANSAVSYFTPQYSEIQPSQEAHEKEQLSSDELALIGGGQAVVNTI